MPESPSDVQRVGKNSSAITLSWQPARYMQDKYKIEYKPLVEETFYVGKLPQESYVEFPFEDQNRPFRMVQTIGQLIPGTAYEFSIKTGSGIIWSKPAEITAATSKIALYF